MDANRKARNCSETSSIFCYSVLEDVVRHSANTSCTRDLARIVGSTPNVELQCRASIHAGQLGDGMTCIAGGRASMVESTAIGRSGSGLLQPDRDGFVGECWCSRALRGLMIVVFWELPATAY